MVAINRGASIINQDELISTIRRNGISHCRVRTKFLENADVEIEKDNNQESFLNEIQNKIIEIAKRLPHRQVILKIKKENTNVDIIVNPVTGAA